MVTEKGKIFLDTSVLVYSADRHSPARQRRARELLRSVQENGNGVVSTQVLQEFYVAATRKLGIAQLIAKGMLDALRILELIVVDREIIREAIDCSILDRISFWDALIITAAAKAKCAEIWTEDLSDGQMIRTVRIHNPF